jgi:hypothetical protein
MGMNSCFLASYTDGVYVSRDESCALALGVCDLIAKEGYRPLDPALVNEWLSGKKYPRD